jgi:hypothetical protein
MHFSLHQGFLVPRFKYRMNLLKFTLILSNLLIYTIYFCSHIYNKIKIIIHFFLDNNWLQIVQKFHLPRRRERINHLKLIQKKIVVFSKIKKKRKLNLDM